MEINEKDKVRFYQAFVERDSAYDGMFFAGIKTTGIFCHATCPARKAKFENCEFFSKAESALLAGYRPCKKCNPLTYPQELPPEVAHLVSVIEADPAKHWNDRDFEELGIHSATARRLFKKHYGMTFVQYARARRMGFAHDGIRKGQSVINKQLDSGYESSSGFHDAFAKVIGTAPTQSKTRHILYFEWIDTPLGPMLSIADNSSLFLLEFADRDGLEDEIQSLNDKGNTQIVPGRNPVIVQITNELHDYFAGTLSHFKTPLHLGGTPFQNTVWEHLQASPTGAHKPTNNLQTHLTCPTVQGP